MRRFRAAQRIMMLEITFIAVMCFIYASELCFIAETNTRIGGHSIIIRNVEYFSFRFIVLTTMSLLFFFSLHI